jgi:MOSC domain-containing protein YiiM
VPSASEAPRLVSVQVGRPRTHGRPDATDPLEREWTSAYVKDPVTGPVRLTATQLAGDEQYDTASHGGPHMAVLAYAAGHYPRWREELGRPEMGPGGFGENFTIEGLDESLVCIGDRYTIGTARVQVSQPRGPCANIARRWKLATMVRRVTETGRTGWYFRVLEEGQVQAGDVVRRIGRVHPGWTVERVFRLKLAPSADRGLAAALAACAELSPPWRESFARVIVG